MANEPFARTVVTDDLDGNAELTIVVDMEGNRLENLQSATNGAVILRGDDAEAWLKKERESGRTKPVQSAVPVEADADKADADKADADKADADKADADKADAKPADKDGAKPSDK